MPNPSEIKLLWTVLSLSTLITGFWHVFQVYIPHSMCYRIQQARWAVIAAMQVTIIGLIQNQVCWHHSWQHHLPLHTQQHLYASLDFRQWQLLYQDQPHHWLDTSTHSKPEVQVLPATKFGCNLVSVLYCQLSMRGPITNKSDLKVGCENKFDRSFLGWWEVSHPAATHVHHIFTNMCLWSCFQWYQGLHQTWKDM